MRASSEFASGGVDKFERESAGARGGVGATERLHFRLVVALCAARGIMSLPPASAAAVPAAAPPPADHVAPPTLAALAEPAPRRRKQQQPPPWRLIIAAAATLGLSVVGLTVLDPHLNSAGKHDDCPRWLAAHKKPPLLPGPTASYSHAKQLHERRQRLLASALAAARKVRTAAASNSSSLWASDSPLAHLYKMLTDGRCVAETRHESYQLETARSILVARVGARRLLPLHVALRGYNATHGRIIRRSNATGVHDAHAKSTAAARSSGRRLNEERSQPAR